MYTELNKNLIFILVLFYLLFNVYIKKYYNIVIFVLMFSVLNNFITDKITLLMGIYCIIISISIVKHFHLLENFESNSDTPARKTTTPKKKKKNFKSKSNKP